MDYIVIIACLQLDLNGKLAAHSPESYAKYLTLCSLLGDGTSFKEKHRAKIHNIFKVLGYIPFLGGQVAGVFHIKNSIQLFQLDMGSAIKLSAVVLLIRGVSEICGVGFLFFFVDIAKLGADGINELVKWKKNHSES